MASIVETNKRRLREFVLGDYPGSSDIEDLSAVPDIAWLVHIWPLTQYDESVSREINKRVPFENNLMQLFFCIGLGKDGPADEELAVNRIIYLIETRSEILEKDATLMRELVSYHNSVSRDLDIAIENSMDMLLRKVVIDKALPTWFEYWRRNSSEIPEFFEDKFEDKCRQLLNS